MRTRRDVLKVLLYGTATLGPMSSLANSTTNSKSAWRMPDEADPHSATWMAFGADIDVWGERLMPGVQANLALIARTIARFEEVNMLVREEEYELAERLCGSSVHLIVQPIDDLWMRDSGPVFVKNAQNQLAAVNFNFNGWGGKQVHRQDAKVAPFVSQEAGVNLLTTRLVLEGGGIEVDGEGTAIITESCVLNRNRNPGVSKAQCETELKRLLGLEKIIWLPGIAERDITDGHTDFYARFTSPGVVVAGYDPDPASEEHAVTKRHWEILRQSSDAHGRKLRVLRMDAPNKVRSQFSSDEFAAGYINFYVCNEAVIAPEFGDPVADRRARDILRDLFPKREVIQLNIDAIAAGGGGIHCTTQQQPR